MSTKEFYEWLAFYSYQEKMRKAEEAKVAPRGRRR